MKDFKKLILTPEYDFLITDEHLKNRIALLTLGGSHAYGTFNANSDVDIRGIALERPADLIGFSEFEQVIDRPTDTVIYAFNKIVGLLLNCNPNTIEMLGGREQDYIYLNEIGRLLLKYKMLFLSKRCINSFGGYSLQQLNRMMNALARDRMSQAQKEEHILNSVRSAMLSFDSRYAKFDENAIRLFIRESLKEDLETEIFLDIDLKGYPLREFASILAEMQNILRAYGKINHRNNKKDDAHINKHAMHLVRLYLMVIDLLELMEIITYREKDLDLLLSIRNGKYQKADGTYDDSFFDMLNQYKKRFEYAAKHTMLPDAPDLKAVEELVMEVNRKIILGTV